MSEAATNAVAQPERVATQVPMPPPPAQRSRAASVLAQTFASVGPKLGLAWIGLVAFLGVFGPLVANTYPVLMKAEGRISSPLIQYLNWADVALLVGTPLAIAIWFYARRQWSARRRFAVIAVMYAVLTGLALGFVRPPQIQEFDRVRELERQGKLEWAIRTPIPYSPTDRLRDLPSFDSAGKPHPFPPSRTHWLGTEQNRSDIASRMVHACRIALTLGFIATGLSTLIGVVVGALTGYFAGWVDLVGQRIIEVFSAIPTLFLMLAAVAFFGRGIYMLMLIIGLTSWVGTARFVRAEFLRYRNVDFVQAARALGLPLHSILFKHLLPNALAPVLVEVSFGVAGAILAESGLSFLGLGLIDEPSWGALLNQAVGSTGGFQWWLAVFPGAAIFLTVMAYNLIGESLRDALDPKLRQRE